MAVTEVWFDDAEDAQRFVDALGLGELVVRREAFSGEEDDEDHAAVVRLPSVDADVLAVVDRCGGWMAMGSGTAPVGSVELPSAPLRIKGLPIHHVALISDWEAAVQRGSYRISTRGLSFEEVGFIHCSRADQVEATIAAFYADVRDDVVVLTIDRQRLSDAGIDVRDEYVDDVGDFFPHIYAPLPVDVVVDVSRFVR